MLPPSMPISIFFLVRTLSLLFSNELTFCRSDLQAALTLLLGMLLGWAWGCLGMAAGVAARSSTLLASQYQTVAQDIGNNPDATAASYVFQGVFLDTRSVSFDSCRQTRCLLSTHADHLSFYRRSSAVFGALFFVWCFAMGALRAHLPKLTLLFVRSSSSRRVKY